MKWKILAIEGQILKFSLISLSKLSPISLQDMSMELKHSSRLRKKSLDIKFQSNKGLICNNKNYIEKLKYGMMNCLISIMKSNLC